MLSALQSVFWAVCFILAASAFAYMRRFIADTISDLCEQTHPLKVIARLVVLLLAICLTIVFGAILVALVLTWARGLLGS